METYTTYTDSSGIEGAHRHLSAVDAMDNMLTYDGYRYEIRPEADGNGWRLWCSDGSENSTRGARHMVRTVVYSLDQSREFATFEIAERVIFAGWPRMPECMTDEAFDAMLADIAVEA